MRRITALLGGAAVVVTAGLSAAAPAMAAATHPAAQAGHATHAAPARRFDPGDGIVLIPALNTNGGEFMTAEGVGAQVQTTGSGTAWNTSAATIGFKVMPGSNGNHCLQQVGQDVEIENCAAGNENQWWTFTGTGFGNGGNNTIVSVGGGGYAGVFNPNVDKPVYAEGEHTGYYVGWAVTH